MYIFAASEVKSSALKPTIAKANSSIKQWVLFEVIISEVGFLLVTLGCRQSWAFKKNIVKRKRKFRNQKFLSSKRKRKFRNQNFLRLKRKRKFRNQNFFSLKRKRKFCNQKF